MPATSAGMTGGEALHEENGAKHKRRNGGFPFVMAGYSRPKDGVLSPAYVPAIHDFALVMAGLVPAIHVFSLWQGGKTWMPGTRPGMTVERQKRMGSYSISAAMRFRIWMKRLRSRSPMT
jgi:hypothetical protein